MAAPEGSSCQAAFVWKAADKLRSALAAPMQPAHEYPLWIPTCLVWTASVTTGRNDTSQTVYYYSGGVGTTVFQIQDSTGTLGGTYTVNIVAQ